MRLVHSKTMAYEGRSYIYFEICTLAGNREPTEVEYTWLEKQNKRLQSMVNRALGPDVGMIYTTSLGSRTLILRINDGIIGGKVRSLIGWIELFAMEHEESHVEILSSAFPLGNPGFAP